MPMEYRYKLVESIEILKVLVQLGCAYWSKNPRPLGRGAFKVALFLEIDAKSKESNNDSFRKKIKSGEDMSWEERLDFFRVLYLKATSGVSKVRLNKATKIYDTLTANFKSKMSLLESDYESWVLGDSELHNIKLIKGE